MTSSSDPDGLDIDRLWRALRAHIRQKVRDDDQADDVAQESWLRTIERPTQRIDRLPAWLRVVARHLIVETVRARRSRLQREQAVAKSESVPAAQDHVHGEDSVVLRLVDELPDPYGHVVRLRYLEDWTVTEIAEHLGRSEGTVRSQLKRGLDRLRVRLNAPSRRATRGPERLTALALWTRSAENKVRFSAAGWAAVTALVILVVGSSWIAVGRETVVQSELAAEPVDDASDERATSSVAVVDDVLRLPPHEARATATRARGSATPASGTASATPRAPTRVRGRVVLRTDGTSIGGAHVRGARALDDVTGVELGVSNDDGRFEVSVPSVPMWVWAEHEEYSPTARMEVDAAFASSDREIALLSVHRGRVRGEVVDADGAPIAGAEVVVGFPWAAQAPARGAQLLRETVPPPQTVLADADGRFTAPTPHNGWFRARAPGFATRSFSIDAPWDSVHVVLARGTSTSEPVAAPSATAARVEDDATATWSGSLSAHARALGVELRVKARHDREWTTIEIGPDGRFTTGAMRPDDYDLVASGGNAHGAWLVRSVALADGEDLETNDIELPEPGKLLVRARCPADLDVDGPAMAALRGIATETALHHNDAAYGVRFDRKAMTLEIDRIWPGEYELLLRGAGLRDASAACDVSAGATRAIEVDMEGGFTLFVRVSATRSLEPGEELQGFLDTPRGSVPIEHFNPIHPECVDPLTTFNIGAPLDARRLVLRTSRGLRGDYDLRALARKQGIRVTVSLRPE